MKTLRFIGMAVVAMVMSLVVASCGSDDNSSNSNGPAEAKDTKPAYAYLTLDIPQTEDFLKYFDMTVEYNDGTSTQTESVSQPGWNKKLKLKLPAKVTVQVNMTPKPTEDLSQNNTKISCNVTDCGYLYTIVNASDGVIGDLVKISAITTTVSAKVSDVAEDLSNINMNNKYTFVFDENGKLTRTIN